MLLLLFLLCRQVLCWTLFSEDVSILLICKKRFSCTESKKMFVVVVSLLIHVWLFVTQWPAACQAPLSSTISQSLLKFMSIESVLLSNHLVLSYPLLLLPLTFPSIRVFSRESALTLEKSFYVVTDFPCCLVLYTPVLKWQNLVLRTHEQQWDQ